MSFNRMHLVWGALALVACAAGPVEDTAANEESQISATATVAGETITEFEAVPADRAEQALDLRNVDRSKLLVRTHAADIATRTPAEKQRSLRGIPTTANEGSVTLTISR